jgi:hypothetical protein
MGLDVGDELIGHLGQRHLGDVELVLGDQLQQQVEWSGEVVQVDVEPRARLDGVKDLRLPASATPPVA